MAFKLLTLLTVVAAASAAGFGQITYANGPHRAYSAATDVSYNSVAQHPVAHHQPLSAPVPFGGFHQRSAPLALPAPAYHGGYQHHQQFLPAAPAHSYIQHAPVYQPQTYNAPLWNNHQYSAPVVSHGAPVINHASRAFSPASHVSYAYQSKPLSTHPIVAAPLQQRTIVQSPVVSNAHHYSAVPSHVQAPALVRAAPHVVHQAAPLPAWNAAHPIHVAPQPVYSGHGRSWSPSTAVSHTTFEGMGVRYQW